MKPMRAVRAKRSQSSILSLPSTKLNKPTSRRSFFSMLGLGLASIIAAPSVIGSLVAKPSEVITLGTLNPAIGWSFEDVELFNKLPFYLAKMQVERSKEYDTYLKLCSGKTKWTPNMGSVMRAVKHKQ